MRCDLVLCCVSGFVYASSAMWIPFLQFVVPIRVPESPRFGSVGFGCFHSLLVPFHISSDSYPTLVRSNPDITPPTQKQTFRLHLGERKNEISFRFLIFPKQCFIVGLPADDGW